MRLDLTKIVFDSLVYDHHVRGDRLNIELNGIRLTSSSNSMALSQNISPFHWTDLKYHVQLKVE